MIKRLRPGNRIEIRPIDYMLTQNQDVYFSQIAEIVSDNKLEISMPTEKTKMILLQTGHEYETIYITKEGLFHAKMRVLDRRKSGQVYTLLIEFTSKLEKHQRREHYRYPCNLEISAKELTAVEAEALMKKDDFMLEEVPPLKGIFLDLSGGGARFVTPVALKQGEMMAFQFKLKISGIFREFYIVSKVISISETQTTPRMYEHRIRFVHIKQSERELIIQYIFDEERKNRKKANGS